MTCILNIILSSVGGVAFFYILYTYNKRGRILNTLYATVAAVLDTYPVLFGEMAKDINIAGAIHGLITLAAYMFFVVWMVTYDYKVYRYFCMIWVAAYLSGYIAAAERSII
ncbi:hypothetical protein DRP04_00295 [Archaeoglobales archaeon]|jgi:hypothetical protein|nr:MAG: hypothetical protein DRP04_00295 [Archaeoglobales archaeon]